MKYQLSSALVLCALAGSAQAQFIGGTPAGGATISPGNSGPPIQFSGFTNRGFGSADVQAAGGALVVSNLGSSGNDGVKMQSPPVFNNARQLMRIAIDTTSGSPANGDQMLLEPIGTLDGFAGQSFGNLILTYSGANTYAVEPAFFAQGAGGYTLRIYSGDTLVFEDTNLSGPAFSVSAADGEKTLEVDIRDLNNDDTWTLSIEDAGSYTPSGGNPVQGDRAEMSISGHSSDADRVFRVKVNGFNGNSFDQFEVDEESMFFIDHVVTGEGDADLNPISAGVPNQAGPLSVDNLGSSGQDGVRVALTDPNISLNDISYPSGIAGGGSITAVAGGTVNGSDNSLIGFVSATENGGDFDVSGDFGAIGAATVTVEVLSGGSSVFSASGISSAATAQDAPSGADWLDGTLGMRWSAGQTFAIPGNGSHAGDELRFTADSPTDTVDSTEFIALITTDIARIIIDSAVSTPADNDLGTPYCNPAVANSSGFPAEIFINGSDVVLDNDITLSATGMPTNQFGYFIASQTQGFVAEPGCCSVGNLCVVGTIARFQAQVQSTGGSGEFSIEADISQMPTFPATAVMAGETWNFQTWYRDGGTSNFSDARSVLFQ